MRAVTCLPLGGRKRRRISIKDTTHCLFGLLLLAAAGADASSCNIGCSQSDSGLLKYQPGNVYEYNFDSVLTVLGSSASGGGEQEDTSLKIVGQAKVYASGNCGYTLQLGAVKVTATKEALEKRITQSIQKPVQFALTGGQLAPVLCADAGDNIYALNVKRAIVSLLQASPDAKSEVDVFGVCQTHSSSTGGSGGAQLVTKVRNLNNCAHREQLTSGLVSGQVNARAGVHTSQLLQADYSKETKLQGGIVSAVHLVEEYRFAAGLGKVTAAAQLLAKVVTNLKIKNLSGSAAQVPALPATAAPTSVIYQKPDTYTSKNGAALKAALADAVQHVEGHVKRDSARSFVELIRLLRHADADSLLELAAAPNPNKVLARKVYLDALFRTGTVEAARATIKQLAKMDDKEKALALLSLTQVQVVDKETLQQAAGLLNANSPQEAYLAVGHLVGKYCRHSTGGCAGAEFEAISKKFIDNLKHCRANTKKDEDRLLYVLKGIGNTHHVGATAAPALSECISAGRSTRIRVAALRAYATAASCLPALQQRALELLRDRNEDSELRIEAYLAAVACPTAQLANDIAELVNSETVYQVGGFIASHLRALRDSTDATREQQRKYLGNVRVTKQFPRNTRRYSYNNELSYKLEALGLGASADHSLIYSQSGFLPRSARLNLTAALLGTDFNVLDVSVRQENIEHVLEYYVGPKGLLNKDFEDIMKVIELGDGGTRTRRSIADDTGKVAKKYKTYGSKPVQDVNLDLSAKLFGSELLFLSLGDNIPSSLDEVIRFFSVALDRVKRELSAFNREFHVHSLFLDTKLAYPTGVGVPLELSAQGLAASHFDVGISVDVDAILEQNWPRAQYRLKLVPSVDVQLELQLGFNALVLSTGVRLAASAHSAAGSDVTLSFINDGNGFNIAVELPREKLELINLQLNTDFYVAEQDKPVRAVALKSAKKRQPTRTEMCFNQLELYGFNFCFESSDLSQLQAPGPLLAPHDFSLYMTTERKLNLKFYHIPQTSSGTQQWKLDYATPGSQQPHDTSLGLELGVKPRALVRLTADSGQQQLALEAGLNNDAHELVYYAQYEHNGQLRRNKLGFTKHGNEYRPLIEVQDKQGGVVNDLNGYRTDGVVVVQPPQGDSALTRYNFQQFRVVNKQNEGVVANGYVDVGQLALKSELRVQTGEQRTHLVQAQLQLGKGDYNVGLFVSNERAPQHVYGASALIKAAEGDVRVHVVGKARQWQLDVNNELQYVRQPSSGEQRISSSDFKTSISLKQLQQLVAAFQLNGHTEGQQKLELQAELQRGKQLAALTVNYKSGQHATQDYQLELNAKYNKHLIDLLAKCEAASGNRLLVDNVLTTSWGTALTIKGELGQRYTAQDVLVNLQGSVQFTAKHKPAQWLLKVNGSPEKSQSEFKLTRDNVELVRYTGETQHPQDKITASKLKLSVRQLLELKADFKLAKNGKGELVTSVETQRGEPKHQLELQSKFHIQAPRVDIETTVTLDGAADKRFYFKTESVLDKQKFSTKNQLEAAAHKLSFDASGTCKGDLWSTGEQQGSFAANGGSGRAISGSFSRKTTLNAKTGILQGSIELQLKDQLADGRHRTLAYSGKADKYNWKQRIIAVEHKLDIGTYAGQQLQLDWHVQHLAKGEHSKTADVGLTISGDVLNVPQIQLGLVVDEYSSKHGNYQLSGKYGDQLSARLSGKYNVGERGQTPATFEFSGGVQAPQTHFRTFDISTSGKLLRPATKAGGVYQLELNIDEKAGAEQFVRLNAALEGSRHQGGYTVKLETKQMNGPLTIEATYQREQTGSYKEGNAQGKQLHSLNYSYGGRHLKVNSDVTYASSGALDMHYTLDSSLEATVARNIDVRVQGHKLEEQGYALSAQAQANDKAYETQAKLYRAAHKQGVDVRVQLPQAQPIVVVAIYELLGSHKGKVQLEVANICELDVKSGAEASYKDHTDFYVLAQWNSARLQLHDYELEVRAQGDAISMQLKHAQGVVFAGDAHHSLKREQNRVTIEGQGQVQYKGTTQQTSFKLIRQLYELQADGELGHAYTFNGNFGPKNGVATLKLTNKEFNVKLSICEEKKQCTNVQLQALTTADAQQPDAVQHALLVLVDLRELGYPYEFNLQSKLNQHGFKREYSLDANIISAGNLNYQLLATVQPASAKLQLKLPRRELLFETKQQTPPAGQFFGHYEQSATFYFDKTHKPQEKTALIAAADVSGVARLALNVQGGVRLENPHIRTLSVSGKLDTSREQQQLHAEAVFDVFRQPAQQLVATGHWQNTAARGYGFNVTTSQTVRSTGLGIEYTFNAHTALNTASLEFSAGVDVHSGGGDDAKARVYAYGNKDHVELSVHGLNAQLLQISGQFDWQHYHSKFETRTQLFSQRPLEISVELQLNGAKMTLKRAELIDASGEMQLGKELKFHVIGAGKQLFDGRVALDTPNFLQSTYTTNAEDVQAYLDTVEREIRQENEVFSGQIRARYAKLRQHIEQQLALAKDSTPDFETLKQSYDNNINDIVKELEADPALKALAENYYKIYTKLAKWAGDIAKTSSESYEKIHKSLLALYEKLEHLFKDTILPVWQEFLVTASKLMSELRVHFVQLITKTFQTLLAMLEQYGPAMKSYGKAVNETLKPIHEALQEFYKVLSNASEEFLNELKEYLSKLPTFDELRADIREKLQQLQVLEKTLEFVRSLFEQLHVLPQTPETAAFLEKAHRYIEAKLQQQVDVDDEAALEELFKLFVKAARAIWSSWAGSEHAAATAADAHANSLSHALLNWPHSLDVLQLPALFSLRVSLLNLLLNEGWSLDMLSKEQLRSQLLFDDFELSGHISEGHQFITYDGQHVDFAGSCKYIVTQDSVDNNFTVVAQLQQGRLKSLTLVERDGAYAELSDAGALKLNGQPVEYPQHVAGGLHAWRRYYTVWLRSEYGVEVMCTVDLKVCHVTVNGFYTSKLRGLLGNGNAEPYDDLLQVDGSIAAEAASFGNGYALGKCQPLAAAAEPKRADICSELFDYDSTLVLGYLFVDARAYRQACDAAVLAAPAKDQEQVACSVATAYVSALRLKQVYTVLPTRCLKCSGAPGQRDLYQEFTQKIPSNKADLVFVVDMDVVPAVLTQLVAPAIAEVRDTLKARGFSDVHVAVIAYNDSLEYPALLTSDNGKLNYQGNLAELQLSGPKSFGASISDQLAVDQKLLNVFQLLERLVRSIEPQASELAFRMALHYPFRAGAAKSIIGVRSKPIEYDSLLRILRTHIAGLVNNADAIIMHTIGPVKQLVLEGVPNEKIIGFNARLVATVDGKDAKKRSKLQFSDDLVTEHVLASGGWVFATQHFETLAAADQKKALQQVTNTLADTLFKTEVVAECQCVSSYGLHAKHSCAVKSSNFVPNKKPKAAA